MVQLRVINGGKSKVGHCHPSVRLFSAHSLVDNFQGSDGVRLNWVCLERENPVAPYETLIEGYNDLDERVRSYFEEFIRELFTEDEIRLLEAYLVETVGPELHIQEEPLPASSIFIPMPFRQVCFGKGRGFHNLFGEAQYDLPFKAGAYYDLRNCPPSVALQPTTREMGLAYLQQALKFLGLESQTLNVPLENTVEALFNEMGLYVEKGKTKEERIRDRELFLEERTNNTPKCE
jgi:hypothetical protein